MTGLPYPVGLTLLLGGALFVLAGLALLAMASRPRATRAQDDPLGGTNKIDPAEILEPPTVVIPQIRPAARPSGELFTPYENPGEKS